MIQLPVESDLRILPLVIPVVSTSPKSLILSDAENSIVSVVLRDIFNPVPASKNNLLSAGEFPPSNNCIPGDANASMP